MIESTCQLYDILVVVFCSFKNGFLAYCVTVRSSPHCVWHFWAMSWHVYMLRVSWEINRAI